MVFVFDSVVEPAPRGHFLDDFRDSALLRPLGLVALLRVLGAHLLLPTHLLLRGPVSVMAVLSGLLLGDHLLGRNLTGLLQGGSVFDLIVNGWHITIRHGVERDVFRFFSYETIYSTIDFQVDLGCFVGRIQEDLMERDCQGRRDGIISQRHQAVRTDAANCVVRYRLPRPLDCLDQRCDIYLSLITRQPGFEILYKTHFAHEV